MTWQSRYLRNKEELQADNKLNEQNRKIWKLFFEYEENKLKRQNGLRQLDEHSYKTLTKFISKFRVINRWFKNKSWKSLTEKDIREVYNDLEDGKLLTEEGLPYVNKSLNKSYFSPVFKGKPFELAGKKDIVKKVILYTNKCPDDVRFFREGVLRQLVSFTIQPIQKCLEWLAFDIGENIGSLLLLKKKDFHRQINDATKEAEYLVNLNQEILKRSRTARSEITNYKETAEILDIVLKPLNDDDLVFPFGIKSAEKFLRRATALTGAKCEPKGQKITWKDFRSSMACDLLLKGWTIDEINARLGHKPSSQMIDKYVTFLAIDRKKPKAKVYENNLREMQGKMERLEEINKLNTARIERLTSAISEFRAVIERKQGLKIESEGL